jgi:ATP-dependent DNA ligase
VFRANESQARGFKASGWPWIYEIKFDGYRALALRGGAETRILSRNQKDLGKKFPSITDAIAKLRRTGRDH